MNQTEFQKPSVLRLCLLHCQFTSKLKKTSYMIFKVFPILWLPAEAHKRWYIESQLQYFLRVIFILFKRWPKNIYKEDALDLFNILSLLYSDSSVIFSIFLSLSSYKRTCGRRQQGWFQPLPPRSPRPATHFSFYFPPSVSGWYL